MTLRCAWRWLPAVICAIAMGGAVAQDYPNKSIRLIVPFAAGGSTDVLARLLAPRLHERLGQQLVVDNRPGAGTTLGMELLAKAPADGYTIAIATTSFAGSASLYRKLAYDPLNDFSFVGQVAVSPIAVVAHPSLPVRTIQELVALAKAKPGEITYASGGNGTVLHLTGAMFASRVGIDVVHVPYKGEGPAMSDLLAGHVSCMIVTPQVAMPHIKAGKLRALAVTSAKRLDLWPDVPTLGETVAPGFNVSAWYGYFAPAKTPQTIVNRLNAELAAVLALPEVTARLHAEGIVAAPSSPAEFAALVRAEIDRWGKIIKATGATAD